MATKDFEKRQKKKIARAKTKAKVDEIKTYGSKSSNQT